MNWTHHWFYVPDLATWERVHVSFAPEQRETADDAEMALLRDLLPEGAQVLAADLGANYVVAEADGRITYFDCSQYYLRSAPESSLVYPLATSLESWIPTLGMSFSPSVGSRAWRLAEADRQRPGGTRREEMWHLPDISTAQCIERRVFVEFSGADYAE